MRQVRGDQLDIFNHALALLLGDDVGQVREQVVLLLVQLLPQVILGLGKLDGLQRLGVLLRAGH